MLDNKFAAKKTEIMALKKAGISLTEISRILLIPYSTVRRIVREFEINPVIIRKEGSGRPKKLGSASIDILMEEVEKNPKTNCSILANKLLGNAGITVSAETIRRYLISENLVNCAAAAKPLLEPRHIAARYSMAMDWLMRPKSYNQRIIFSDESRFSVFQSDGKVRVWREKGTRYQMNNLSPTVKFNSGSIMVWACITYNGVGCIVVVDGKMDSVTYVRILAGNLMESVEKTNLRSDFIFQQDNAPCHKSKMTQEFFEKNGIEVMSWPAQSPDLNIIENLWSYVDQKLKFCEIKNKHDVAREVIRIWEAIPLEYIRKLYESIPRRLELVIRNKGGHIPY